MTRIEVRSRVGSVTMAAIGALYLILSVALLAYFVVSTWNAASALDRLLQLSLIASAAGGVYLARIGVTGLHVSFAR